MVRNQLSKSFGTHRSKKDPYVFKRKRKILVSLTATFGLIVSALAFAGYAAPTETACAVAHFSGMDRLADGTLVEQNSSAMERATFMELQSLARDRIKATFGAPRAKPIVVVFGDSKNFWPLKLNTYASAAFIGNRACLLIGPQGQNVDVFAHEFMHAELASRVGYWRRNFEVPAWFDEGLAMQVDLRVRYDWPNQDGKPNGYRYVRRFNSQGQFRDADDAQLTRNYAAAKAEVGQWLNSIGPSALYARLERIRTGEDFDAVLVE